MLNKSVGEEEAGYYRPFVDLQIIFDFQDMFTMYYRCVYLYTCSVYFTVNP